MKYRHATRDNDESCVDCLEIIHVFTFGEVGNNIVINIWDWTHVMHPGTLNFIDMLHWWVFIISRRWVQIFSCEYGHWSCRSAKHIFGSSVHQQQWLWIWTVNGGRITSCAIIVENYRTHIFVSTQQFTQIISMVVKCFVYASFEYDTGALCELYV